MKFLLTSPFHTDLNLKTFQAYRNQNKAITYFEEVILALNENASNAHWRLNWQVNDNVNTLYKSLSDNYFSNASKPILTLEVDDLNWLKASILTVLSTTTTYNNPDFDIESCHVHCYDNTIGILSLTIKTAQTTDLSHIDDFTFELSSITLQVLREYFAIAVNSLTDHPYFLSQVDSDVIFEIEKYNCYWVNRTAVVSEQEFNLRNDDFNKWSKLYNNDFYLHDFHDYKIFFCIGNSIVIDDNNGCITTYLESLNLATYFYCLYLSLNNRVATIFENIENVKLFDINYNTIYKIERLMLFIDNQNENIVFGLQGDSKRIVNSFYKIWDLEVLRLNLESKTTKVNEIYKHERLKKSEKTSKIVQGALTIIGASAIVEVLLSIVSFAHEDFGTLYKDYGLASSLRKINPEFVLVFSLVILLLLTLIVIHEMRRK